MDVASPAPPDPPAADRPTVAGGELRRRIVRGTIVNAVALATIDLLVLAQGLIVTRLPSNLQDRLPTLDRPAAISQQAA